MALWLKFGKQRNKSELISGCDELREKEGSACVVCAEEEECVGGGGGGGGGGCGSGGCCR